MRPKARREGLLVEELEDEVLVYDLERHRAHCLNPTAAFIWGHCDGRKDLPELADLLAREREEPADEEVVLLALERLTRARLVDFDPGAGAADAEGAAPRNESRRRAIRRLAKAGIAVPVVLTIVTPTPAQAATRIDAADCFNDLAGNLGKCCSNGRKCVNFFGFGLCWGARC